MRVSEERHTYRRRLDPLGPADRFPSLATIARETELPLTLVGVMFGLLWTLFAVCVAWRWVAKRVRRAEDR
jgi:hypothetical protein